MARDASASRAEPAAGAPGAIQRLTDQRYTGLVLFAKSTVEATTARQL